MAISDPLFEEEDTAEDDGIVQYNYGKADYWEERYARTEEDFDWFFEWNTLGKTIAQFYTPSDRVLIIGCGNSVMPRDMLDTGFPLIGNIDLSTNIISQLKERYKNEPRLQWFAMNCAQLAFPDQSFDLVIEKGTIDTIMCGDNCDEIVNATMGEVYRVLTNGGRLVVVTFRTPAGRFPAMCSVRRNWFVYPPIVLPLSEEIEDDVGNYIHMFEKREAHP
jgi:ubiquinone/menaquinone biosynthesis C-methylase UbiE